MTRKQQHEILVEYLRSQPGQTATIRQIHIDTWVNNVPDAAMRARKRGYTIITEKDPTNPKIASYRLVEGTEDYRDGKGTPAKTIQGTAKLRPEGWEVSLEEVEVEVTRDKKGKLLEVHNQPLFPQEPTGREYE